MRQLESQYNLIIYLPTTQQLYMNATVLSIEKAPTSHISKPVGKQKSGFYEKAQFILRIQYHKIKRWPEGLRSRYAL